MSLQISADPALVTGMTLMSCAFAKSFVVVVVNHVSMFTFHFVVNQVSICRDAIDPAQTVVHSEPLIYLV